jgi:EmrB/QacA subfamily drug resistance transporter
MERKWRVLGVVCIAVFMLLLDITVVNVALPDIQRELHTSFTELQWVVDAYALTLAAMILNAGTLGDLRGRKRVFLVSIALFTVASALCGAANSALFLILARGLQGIGGAGMFAVSLAIIAQEFHGRERGTAFGIWGATIGIAVAIGPLVGGVLTTYAGWRWIFFVNVPIGIAVVTGGIRELHESRNEEAGGFDLAGFLTLTPGLFALVIALFQGNSWGWSSGRTIGLFVASAVLLGAFAFIELRKRSPMFEFRLFRVPTFTGAQTTAFTISAGMFSMFLFLTLYLQDVVGYTAVKTGVLFLPLTLTSFFVAPVAGRLSARFPVRIFLGGGLAVVGLSLVLMHGLTVSSTASALMPGFVLGGIGIGLVNAPLAATAVSVVEPQRAGMASGINNTFRQVGIATGIAALGAIFLSQIASSLPGRDPHWAQSIASGSMTPPDHSIDPKVTPTTLRHIIDTEINTAHTAFISGLNSILLVAAIVLFVGAVLAVLLVREKDFVASGPAAAGH